MISERSATSPGTDDDDVELILLRHSVTLPAPTAGPRPVLNDHLETGAGTALLFNLDHVVAALPRIALDPEEGKSNRCTLCRNDRNIDEFNAERGR